ncbi:hypothetical protein SADUNF_Sadunf05G0008300 [Salix dunnii]|uniref:R13L1/DRL21-like LRR repeat region domain-containing protein n=1 Tax=Salix dunnii TaxID=1413687 RepID=A0A835K350_9ROSI|nr:hypothetical protein SADUNF_Sadunf05G0008300 [Salix dunnii]
MLNVEAGSAIDGASHIHHLNLISCEDVESIFRAVDARKLRTVFSKRHLRYLDVSYTSIRALPKSITNLYHLETLRLKNCNNCIQLPTLGCLPRLKILKISGMGTVKCIGNEFYISNGKAGVLFPALKELTLSHMGALEEWMVPSGEGDQVFPCLEKLSIQGCEKLKSIPICGLSSLVDFVIQGCGELRYLSGEFHDFTSLQLLRIRGCEKLESIPSIQHCTSLVELKIQWCSELISIPGDFRELKYSLKKFMIDSCKLGALPSGLQCCVSLEELWIWDCRELIHINDLQELSSLRRLWIYGCHKLINIDWHGLRQLRSLGRWRIFLQDLSIHFNTSGSLEFLGIYGWDKLKSVPHQLQHLTALKRLYIRGFRGEEFEEALPEWLANLSSLQYLRIAECKNLKYLQSSRAIQRLSKLKELSIWRCPLLSENYRKEKNGSFTMYEDVNKMYTYQ